MGAGVGIGSDSCRRLDQQYLHSTVDEGCGKVLERSNRELTSGCQV